MTVVIFIICDCPLAPLCGRVVDSPTEEEEKKGRGRPSMFQMGHIDFFLFSFFFTFFARKKKKKKWVW
jgi:hypothetical protein